MPVRPGVVVNPIGGSRRLPANKGNKMPDRIFVVEDDEATRYAYERALQAAGYQTAGFGTFVAAAPEIDKGAGALLVVDVQSPPGTPQGPSVARMTLHRRPDLPIIFVTGYPEVAALADADTGPIMLKPFELSVLVITVRERLTASPMHSA